MSITAVGTRPAAQAGETQVLVKLGPHPIVDWHGPTVEAQAFAEAMARRFRSCTVETHPHCPQS